MKTALFSLFLRKSACIENKFSAGIHMQKFPVEIYVKKINADCALKNSVVFTHIKFETLLVNAFCNYA